MGKASADLERLWPDPDRRDDALLRLGRRVELEEHVRSGLTPNEARVIEAYSHGLRRPEIAELLGITLETVKDRRRRAMRILAAKTTTHAVAIALRAGIIR